MVIFNSYFDITRGYTVWSLEVLEIHSMRAESPQLPSSNTTRANLNSALEFVGRQNMSLKAQQIKLWEGNTNQNISTKSASSHCGHPPNCNPGWRYEEYSWSNHNLSADLGRCCDAVVMRSVCTCRPYQGWSWHQPTKTTPKSPFTHIHTYSL